MELKKIALIVFLVVGVILVSGCISKKQLITTSTSSTSIMTTTTTIILRPIDIICPSDLAYWKQKVGEEELYKPVTHGFDCRGNKLICATCEFYPSFVLTQQYNLTELEVKAKNKGYSITYEYLSAPLTIIKTVSENETYTMGIFEYNDYWIATNKPAEEGHYVVAIQDGKCCLDEGYIKNKFREILEDLDLEYSGLNESRIERKYVVKVL